MDYLPLDYFINNQYTRLIYIKLWINLLWYTWFDLGGYNLILACKRIISIRKYTNNHIIILVYINK